MSMGVEVEREGRFLKISFNGKEVATLARQFFSKKYTEVLSCTSEEELLSLERSRALSYAYSLLAAQPRLSRDIVKKLKERGVCVSAIEFVVEECTRLGYLDDDRESRGLIEREIRRGRGPRVIGQKIRDRNLIEELFPREVQMRRIRELLEKRETESIADKQKALRFLLQRGFTHETIWEILNSI